MLKLKLCLSIDLCLALAASVGSFPSSIRPYCSQSYFVSVYKVVILGFTHSTDHPSASWCLEE